MLNLTNFRDHRITPDKKKKINQLCLTRVTHNSLGLTNLWPSGSGSKWNLEMLVFEERGKPEYPEKNLSEQRREPTTNSTHI